CFLLTLSFSFVFPTTFPRRPRSTLFPYTTLFRSVECLAVHGDQSEGGLPVAPFVVVEQAPVQVAVHGDAARDPDRQQAEARRPRSEEHTSELQSRFDLVCRLLLEKKKKITNTRTT